MSKNWSLIAHGGAKDIAHEEEAPERHGMVEAIEAGSKILANGGSALEAVEAVVKLLEKNPVYNAGYYGSVKNEDGVIELDASIMDGTTLDIGAVAGLQEIEYPIMVARALLREREIFLVGEGAQKFAEKLGLPKPSKTTVEAKHNIGCDTVGCVARDDSGAIAAATSTGGLEGTRAGRVGDVPLPGCGFYADNKRGGVSASGNGESIARIMLAAEFLNLVKDMDPNQATKQALQHLERIGGADAGLIAIAPDGKIGWNHTSPNFTVGMASAQSGMKIYLKKAEENEDAQ